MKRGGWIGRPLLGHEIDEGVVQLWTGSHRWAAAEQIGLAIPVVIVPAGALEAARESASWSVREDRPFDPDTIGSDLVDWPEIVDLLSEESEPT
jgi:hypothetical protein